MARDDGRPSSSNIRIRNDALVCKQAVPVNYLVLWVVNCSPTGLASG